jgi:hypothetical protein
MKPNPSHITTSPDGSASVEWKLVGRVARIAHLTTGETSTVSFMPWPDLSEARERYPRLAGLWDRVRHDYWVEMLNAGMLPGDERPATQDAPRTRSPTCGAPSCEGDCSGGADL